jgi:tetratricopeptide (TPR) repeat protein
MPMTILRIWTTTILISATCFFGVPATGDTPATPESEWLRLLQTGQALNNREKYLEAVPALEAARDAAVRQNVSQLQQAAVWDALGAAYERVDRLADAHILFDRALAVRQKFLTDPDEALAVSLTNESSVFWALGKPAEAEQYASKAKLMWEKLGQPNRWEYAAAINNLVAAYRMEGRILEAVPLMQQACEIYRHNFSAASPRLVRALINLSLGFKDIGDYKKAEELFNEALRDARTGGVTSPEQIGILLNSMGELKNTQGHYKEAERLVTEALATTLRMARPSALQVATEHYTLGCVFRSLGRTEEAKNEFLAALKSLEGLHGQADILRGEILNNQGSLAQSNHDLKSAEQLYKQAIASFESALGHGSQSSVPSYANLAGLYGAKGQYDKAERVFQSALDRDRSVLPRIHPAVARDLNNLGWVAYKRKHYDRAESFFREALDIYRKTFGAEHVDTAMTEGNLANTLWALKRTREAEGLFENSIEVLEHSWGKDSPKLIETLQVYAKFLRANSESAKAEEAETHALRIRVRQAIAADQNAPRS